MGTGVTSTEDADLSGDNEASPVNETIAPLSKDADFSRTNFHIIEYWEANKTMKVKLDMFHDLETGTNNRDWRDGEEEVRPSSQHGASSGDLLWHYLNEGDRLPIPDFESKVHKKLVEVYDEKEANTLHPSETGTWRIMWPEWDHHSGQLNPTDASLGPYLFEGFSSFRLKWLPASRGADHGSHHDKDKCFTSDAPEPSSDDDGTTMGGRSSVPAQPHHPVADPGKTATDGSQSAGKGV